MEKEQNHGPAHKMCDWCGNEYGRNYSWMRLIVGILIGLFIFSAGYHLGQLNVLVHQSGARYDMPQMRWEQRGTDRMMMNDVMIKPRTSTPAVAPEATTTPAATAPQQ